ncbi:MAG TPA: RagB/SusD family nutrient uptake outer membrane protein [Chitinophagaceae bacterium]|nr:RagB/SusD family nutrient uptake outer membrane protein [Chitinophagaceae bacterium]
MFKNTFIQCCSVIFFAAATSTSCTKNLDQQPVATANESAVFGSQQGLALYSNSFYNILPDINTPFRTDCNLSDYGAVSNVPTFIQPGAFTSLQSSGWSWGNLRNVNYFIQHCNNPAVPEAVRNNYIGLAKFFRAYFYFQMVQRFGDVPWINKPLDVSDTTILYAKRDPRTLVMDSVMADINYAIANINTTNDATRSTITKWVAYGLKSRICLFEGTFRKYQASYGLTSTASQFLQDAANAAKAIIDSAGFSLNTGGNMAYRNLFISTAPVANEVMLADITSTSLGKYNDANWYYTSATYGPRFSFIRTFINTYLTLDGTPFTDIPGHDTITFVNEVKNRDWRLQQTIRTGNYKRISNGIQVPAPPVFSYTYTGYQPIKWCLDDMVNDNGATNTNSICLMRYAEILLNYAEAKAELGTLTDADWAMTIGALRARAGITGGLTTKPTVADPYLQQHYFPDITDPVILEVRRERGIELALEGFRYYDLVRWKHGELLLNTWNGFYVPQLDTPMDLNGDGILDVCFYVNPPANQVSGVTYIKVSSNPQILDHGTYGELHWLDNIPRTWSDYMYLYPIPYSSLQLNPNLGQNPGWK